MLLAHTPKTRGEKSKKEKRERENRVSTEEKMDGVKKERQERKEGEFALGNHTSHHADFRDKIYSVMFLSHNNQFGQKVTLQV